MKKKIWIGLIVLLSALVILLLAVALWPKPEDVDVVGVCYRDGNTKENAAFREKLEKMLSEQGYQVVVRDADLDQNKQISILQELAGQQCDVLLIEPVMQDGAPELLGKIEQLKIPTVLFNKPMDTTLFEPYGDVYYVGYPDSNTVLNHMEMMEKLPAGGDINGDGTVSCLVLNGPEDHRDAAQYEESLQAVCPRNVEILSFVNTDGSLVSGRKLCKDKLAEYGKDIEVIFCYSDQIALGAVEAIADGGRTVGKDVYLFGIGGDAEAVQMIWDGKMTGTVYAVPEEQINTLCSLTKMLFEKKPVDKITLLSHVSVTAENVSEYFE